MSTALIVIISASPPLVALFVTLLVWLRQDMNELGDRIMERDKEIEALKIEVASLRATGC